MHPKQCYGCRHRATEGDESVGWPEFPVCLRFFDNPFLEPTGLGEKAEAAIEKVFCLFAEHFQTIAFGLADINNCPFFEKTKQKTIYDATKHLFEEK